MPDDQNKSPEPRNPDSTDRSSASYWFEHCPRCGRAAQFVDFLSIDGGVALLQHECPEHGLYSFPSFGDPRLLAVFESDPEEDQRVDPDQYVRVLDYIARMRQRVADEHHGDS